MRYEFRIGTGFMLHSKGQSIFIISAIGLGVAVQAKLRFFPEIVSLEK